MPKFFWKQQSTQILKCCQAANQQTTFTRTEHMRDWTSAEDIQIDQAGKWHDIGIIGRGMGLPCLGHYCQTKHSQESVNMSDITVKPDVQ